MHPERPPQPRITAIPTADLTETQRSFVQAGASNVILTLVRHEDLLKAWLGLGERLLFSSRVTPRERELVVLRIWGGLSFAQIARLTGSSVSTVFDRYRHALTLVRARLENSRCDTPRNPNRPRA